MYLTLRRKKRQTFLCNKWRTRLHQRLPGLQDTELNVILLNVMNTSGCFNDCKLLILSVWFDTVALLWLFRFGTDEYPSDLPLSNTLSSLLALFALFRSVHCKATSNLCETSKRLNTFLPVLKQKAKTLPWHKIKYVLANMIKSFQFANRETRGGFGKIQLIEKSPFYNTWQTSTMIGSCSWQKSQ